MRTFGWKALSVSLAVVCLILGIIAYTESVDRSQQSSRIDALCVRAKTLGEAATAARREAVSLRARLERQPPSPIHGLYIDRLRRLGLNSPVEDLVSDLQRHPELIPYPGVLGGQMGFYYSDGIRVLSDSWVYAPFDDGHISGEAILAYQVARGGRISWRVVTSRMIR